MRRLVAVLYFLMLANDGVAKYHTELPCALAWVQPVLFERLPIQIRGFDLAMLLILLSASKKAVARGPRVTPMRKMMMVALWTTLAFFVLGLLRGGDMRAAIWQVYLILGGILAAFTISTVFREPEDYIILGKAYLLAAVYRGTMGLIFYFTYVSKFPLESAYYLTTHDDSVQWVMVVIMLAVNAAEIKRPRSGLVAAIFIPFIIVSIQFNNRRLAWVSLMMAFAVFYALLPKGKAKKTLNKGMLAMVPVMIGYVAVGWSNPVGIFKPIAGFQTVSTVEDASTKARNCENLGLIATAATGWLTGTGYGHKYIELTNKYSIEGSFDLWPYIPHNSILGLFAFTGYLGIMGFWLRFPTAVYLHARTARYAQRPIERGLAIIGAAQVAIVCNQMYGDMGIFTTTTTYTLSVSFALAMRLPIVAKTWPGRPPALTAA